MNQNGFDGNHFDASVRLGEEMKIMRKSQNTFFSEFAIVVGRAFEKFF